MSTGFPAGRIAEQALIAPARCCLKNIGRVGASNDKATGKTGGNHDSPVEERIVEKAFIYLKALSEALKDKFDL